MRFAGSLVFIFLLFGSSAYASEPSAPWQSPMPSARLLRELAREMPLTSAISDNPLTENSLPDTPLPAAPVTRSFQSPVLFTALATTHMILSVLDWHSTSNAVDRGLSERNPVLAPLSSKSAALLATKTAVAATTVYLTARVWKHNRTAGIALMVAANVASSIIVAHNYSVARQ